MNIGRIVASTLIRRLTVIGLGLLLAWCGLRDAHAQTDNKEQAWNKCAAAGLASIQGYPTGQWRCNDQASPAGWRLERYIPGPGNDWISPPGQSFFPYVACPAGTTWDPVTHKCFNPAECLAKPMIGDKAVRGAQTLCSDGCTYAPRPNHENNPNQLNLCMAGAAYCAAALWEPTGGSCSTPAPGEPFDKNKDTCVLLSNGYGECVKPDGTHCWTNSAGKSTCWKPGETGPKVTSDRKHGSDRKAAPGIPTAPSNMPGAVEQGSSTTTINNTTYNSSSYSSGGGGDGTPGQPDTGVPGDDDGDGEPDDDGGEAGAGVGNLYESSGKTMASVYATFKTRVSNAPFIHAADNFLTVNSGGGSCPIWTLPAGQWNPALTFDWHCSGDTAQYLAWAAWMLLAVVAFFSWRVAVE